MKSKKFSSEKLSSVDAVISIKALTLPKCLYLIDTFASKIIILKTNLETFLPPPQPHQYHLSFDDEFSDGWC